MKKIIVLWIAAILLGCSSVFVFVSCNDAPEENNALTEDGALRLLSFESYEEMLRSMTFLGANSKIELNTDKRYVTDGERSMHLKMNGVLGENAAVYEDSAFHVLPATPNLQKADFTDTAYFGLDIWNESGFEVEFMFGSYRVWLKEGLNRLAIATERIAENYKNISSFAFHFRGGTAEQGPMDLYIDNFRAFLDDESVLQKTMDFSGDVWYDFSDAAQTKCFLDFGGYDSEFTKPEFSVNRDTAYTLSGDTSMKVRFFEKRDGSGMDCTAIRTSSGTTEQPVMLGDFTKYEGPENWYLTSNVFNATDRPIKVTMQVWTFSNEIVTTPEISIAPGAWGDPSAMRIYVNDMQEQLTGTGLDIQTIIFLFSGIEEDGTVYVDHIKMEK